MVTLMLHTNSVRVNKFLTSTSGVVPYYWRRRNICAIISITQRSVRHNLF
jgi:hypothetical protein